MCSNKVANRKIKRKSLSRKIRFEVFKRDSFTCQYCGDSAPDVILEADHIEPVSKGGSNEILNLITSCQDCNRGKGARLLSDQSSVKKQKEMLDQLNDRREQIEMMVAWRDGLHQIDEIMIDRACDAFETFAAGHSINNKGRQTLRKILKKFSLHEVLTAIDIVVERIIYDDDGAATDQSVSDAFKKIVGICATKRLPPDQQKLLYIRGILRNRLSYINEGFAIQLLIEAANLNVDIDGLKDLSLAAKNWSEWRDTMEEIISEPQ